MMYNSEDDFIRMLIEWLSTIKDNVNALELAKYEDLGWMAVFPTIGVLFRMIAENYGEHVSTVALGCLSIKALDTLGPRVYMFGTISTLIISAIKNSMTLDSTDVNYSANLVAGMVAIPAAFYTIKKTIMLNQIQSTVTLNTSLSQVNNYVDKAEVSSTIMSLFAGTGKEDSGFALACQVLDIIEEGSIGDSKKDKLSTIVNLFMRAMNALDLSTSGLIVGATLVCAELIFKSAITYFEELHDYSTGGLRNNDDAHRISAANDLARQNRIHRLRQLWKFAKIAVGSALNPISIPFNAASIAVKFVWNHTPNLKNLQFLKISLKMNICKLKKRYSRRKRLKLTLN